MESVWAAKSITQTKQRIVSYIYIVKFMIG